MLQGRIDGILGFYGGIVIVAFEVLLVSAALINEDSVLANEVAVYSHYSLVIGVVLQFALFIRKRPEEKSAVGEA